MTDTTIVKVGNSGRFVIPRHIRQKLNLKDGDPVQVGIEDGKIVILTPQGLLEQFYSLTQNLRNSDKDVVQDLIDERRQEAE